MNPTDPARTFEGERGVGLIKEASSRTWVTTTLMTPVDMFVLGFSMEQQEKSTEERDLVGYLGEKHAFIRSLDAARDGLGKGRR